MDEDRKEKSTENNINKEMLQKVRADICIAAMVGKIATDMNDVMDTESIIQAASGKLDNIPRQQMKWLVDNYKILVKIVKGNMKNELWGDMRNAEEEMLKYLKAARFHINLRRRRVTHEARIRRVKRITEGMRDKLFAIVTPTPREQNDPILRGIINQGSGKSVAEKITINSKNVFSWCVQVVNDVAQNYTEIIVDEKTGERHKKVPVKEMTAMEDEIRSQIVPHIANALDFSRANTRDFRLFIEKELIENRKNAEIQQQLRIILRAWVSACLQNFPENSGEIVSALHKEASDLRAIESEKRIIEDTHWTIKKALARILTLNHLFGHHS